MVTHKCSRTQERKELEGSMYMQAQEWRSIQNNAPGLTKDKTASFFSPPWPIFAADQFLHVCTRVIQLRYFIYHVYCVPDDNTLSLHEQSLLQLLLGPDVRGVATLALTAVGSTGMKTSIALPANHLITVVFLGQHTQGRFNNTTTKTQYKMQRGNSLYMSSKTSCLSLLQYFVLGWPQRLHCQRCIHSVILVTYLLPLFLSLATCSAHLCLLSLMVLILSVTKLCFWIQFAGFRSVRDPTMILSIFLRVVTSFLNWILLSDHVSQPHVITVSMHSLNAFLFSLIGTFLSHMMSSLQNALHPCPIPFFISYTRSWSLVTICPRYTYLSTSLIFFPSTFTSSLLTCLSSSDAS